MQPRIGSLCSGYGGLDTAVIDALGGGRVAWHTQYEPPDKDGRPDRHQWAARILAHHHPDVPNHGDITTIDFRQVEPVDILTAGFPCTDISLAGRRAGLRAGTRSGIWTHVARAIAELRPSLVAIENVRSLTSASADSDMEPCTWCLGDSGDESVLRALGAVLGDLADLGFDAEWTCLRASDVGAPHQRHRIFILAQPADADSRRHPRPQDHTHRAAASRRRGAVAADTAGDRRHEGWPEPAWILRRSDAALGGGAAPADADGDGRERLEERHGDPEAGIEASRRDNPHGRSDASADPHGGQRGPHEHDDVPGQSDVAWGPYAAAVARWEHVLERPAPSPVDQRGRLAPAFVEWMMGLPAGWVTAVPGIPRNAQLKALGNGVVPQQGAAAFRILHERLAGRMPERSAAA